MRAAYFLGGQIGHVAGLLDSQLNARQRFRLKALRAVQRAGDRHQRYVSQLCDVLQGSHCLTPLMLCVKGYTTKSLM